MEPKDESKKTAAPLLVWKVAKVPGGKPGDTLKVGDVRAGLGAQVRLTQEAADTLNGALAGCLEFQGA